MKIETAFELQQEVFIVPLGLVGRVLAFYFSELGLLRLFP